MQPRKEYPTSPLNLYGELQDKTIWNFIDRQQQMFNPDVYVKYPLYDDTPLQTTLASERGFLPILRIAFLIDDGITTIDLEDLSAIGINLHPVMKNIIRDMGKEVFTTKGLFNISILEGTSIVPHDVITMDGLKISVPLTNKSSIHHLIIYEATELKFIDSYVLPTLVKYRWFFPMTIVRHFESLVASNTFKLVNNHPAVRAIEFSMYNGKIDKYLNLLISLGHCGNEIFSYASTPYQLIDYISHKKSLKTGRHLFYEFKDIAIQGGLLTENEAPDPFFLMAENVPIVGPTGVAVNGFNTPLRIIDTTITVK
jgi:hypothetical protein